LEDWLSKNKSGVYIDMGLLPISFLGVDEPNIRFLNIITGIYKFLDEQFDLPAIMVSLDRIFKAAEVRHKLLDVPKQGRDPFQL
jgi:hypothetical protein